MHGIPQQYSHSLPAALTTAKGLEALFVTTASGNAGTTLSLLLVLPDTAQLLLSMGEGAIDTPSWHQVGALCSLYKESFTSCAFSRYSGWLCGLYMGCSQCQAFETPAMTCRFADMGALLDVSRYADVIA